MKRVRYFILFLYMAACYLHAGESSTELGTIIVTAPARFTVGDSHPTTDRKLTIGGIPGGSTWTFLTLPVPPFRIHILWARAIGYGSKERQILAPPVELVANREYSFTIRRSLSKQGIYEFQLLKVTSGKAVLLDTPLDSKRWVAVQKLTE